MSNTATTSAAPSPTRDDIKASAALSTYELEQRVANALALKRCAQRSAAVAIIEAMALMPGFQRGDLLRPQAGLDNDYAVRTIDRARDALVRVGLVEPLGEARVRGGGQVLRVRLDRLVR